MTYWTVSGSAVAVPPLQLLLCSPSVTSSTKLRRSGVKREGSAPACLIPSSMLVMHGEPGRLFVSSVETAYSLPNAEASSGLVCTHLGAVAVLFGNIARPNRILPELLAISLLIALTAIS